MSRLFLPAAVVSPIDDRHLQPDTNISRHAGRFGDVLAMPLAADKHVIRDEPLVRSLRQLDASTR